MRLFTKRFDELTNIELYEILKLRFDVFVLEQRCLYPELDDCDQRALHVWMEDENGIAAYLRIMDRGVESDWVSIGRVVARRRGCGLGKEIMQAGIRAAREQLQADAIYLEAQQYALRFYEKLGFCTISAPFDEDGILHVNMLLEG
ncbi:MAG: GNAT family N-acetyltransferase [Oscillospiraceae bacterium]|nr:GNAT family N-acetyltransferase [Oscillospiraceae bacterium]